MIEGLKLKVPVAVLRVELNERISYHETRAKFYNSRSTRIASNDEDVQYAVNTFTRKAKAHSKKAAQLQFILTYLIEDDYLLTWDNLSVLEIGERD